MNGYKKTLNWILFLISIYLFSWLLKGILLSIYIVPSGSMYPTIYSGDYVVAIKFPYRLQTPKFYPLTNIPFPFYSARGSKEIKKGDILVFSSPINIDLHMSYRMIYLKRVAGLPGDTLTIRDEILKNPNKVFFQQRRPLGQSLPLLKSSEGCDIIVVPKKGKEITIDKDNITKWKTTIKRDGATVEVDSDSNIIINNVRVNSYVFQQNFYFMIGDDYGNTFDSRQWGFLPESHIIGKAFFTIWSTQSDHDFKWLD